MVSSLVEHPANARLSKTGRIEIDAEIRCFSGLPTAGFGDRLGMAFALAISLPERDLAEI
jgi:hypothetical protein